MFDFPTSFVNAEQIPFQLLAKHCCFHQINQQNASKSCFLCFLYVMMIRYLIHEKQILEILCNLKLLPHFALGVRACIL